MAKFFDYEWRTGTIIGDDVGENGDNENNKHGFLDQGDLSQLQNVIHEDDGAEATPEEIGEGMIPEDVGENEAVENNNEATIEDYMGEK